MAINSDKNPPASFGKILWLASMAIAVLAGIFVPYGLLSGSDDVLSVLLFWIGFGVLVIGLIVVGVMRWRNEP